jgi:hypothetical protein
MSLVARGAYIPTGGDALSLLIHLWEDQNTYLYALGRRHVPSCRYLTTISVACTTFVWYDMLISLEDEVSHISFEVVTTHQILLGEVDMEVRRCLEMLTTVSHYLDARSAWSMPKFLYLLSRYYGAALLTCVHPLYHDNAC